MYPIRFEPILQDYVWGGARISLEFHGKGEFKKIAESWEISDRDDAMSVVANGPLKGKTLRELVLEMGQDLLGLGQTGKRFPLLLKILDAKENLSLQVHPDEISAIKLQGEPKTEMWVMLDEGSVLAGLKKEVSPEQFHSAITTGAAAELVEKLDLKKGDAVYIPGGRVHAICAGSLLFEIQQNSNSTYRLFDWGRKGRELHLKEGFEAIHWEDQGHAKVVPHHLSSDLHHQVVSLCTSPFFITERIDIFDRYHVAQIPKTFQVFFCMGGEGKICVGDTSEPIEPGLTYLLPAASNLINIEGKCELLRIRLP